MNEGSKLSLKTLGDENVTYARMHFKTLQLLNMRHSTAWKDTFSIKNNNFSVFN